jgi:DNA-binding ferritin-like protein
MFETKNDLSEEIRAKAIELLNARLADCIDLQTQTKQAHWNVKGLNFIALHELFDGINEEVENYVDDIAERAVQLGGVAEGTARMVAKRSSLREYPANADESRFVGELTEHVHAARVREDFVGGVRSGVNGTPTFFINEERHDGPVSLDSLLRAVEVEIAAATGRDGSDRSFQYHPRQAR